MGDLQPVLLSAPALALFGLCIGSFLNVVIHRLPLMLERAWKLEAAAILEQDAPDAGEPLTLSRPASRCPACGHRIRWFENIPLLSWLVLRGRCSACRTPISPRYPLIELACGGLFAGVGLLHGGSLVALWWCGFVAALLAMAAIDWDTTLLPDNLTLPLMWAGLLAAVLGPRAEWNLPLSQALWGAMAGYLSLWTVDKLFKLVTGRDEGMGNGDFKLLAALGAWLGVQMLLPIVLMASVIGSVVGIAMKLSGSLREGRFIPFGPFLAGAGLVVMYAGAPRVLGWLGWA